MAFPVPLVTGTLLFVLLCVLGGFVGIALRRLKKLNKDETQIFCVSVIVCVLCLWLMWVSTWMHQWHPVIYPILPVGMEGGVIKGGGEH